MKAIHDKEYQQLLEMLRSKRNEMGMTQEQLASILGVRQGIISKIETCERRLDIIELRNICKALDISFLGFVIEFDKCLNKHKIEH